MNNKKYSFIDSFLHNLRILIKEVALLLPDDPKIYRMNKRVMFVIQVDPSYVFNTVGSYLYKYKDFIYDASTEELLLKWDFTEVYDDTDKETEDVSLIIIMELKKCLTYSNAEQKKYYRQLVTELLDNYVEYMTYE